MAMQKLERDPRSLSPMGVVEGVVAFSELNRTPEDSKFLHEFFKRAKENPRFAGILEPFVFSEKEIYPFSPRLETSICKNMFGILVLQRRPARFDVDQKIAEETRKRISKFNPEQAETFQALGEEFKKAVEALS